MQYVLSQEEYDDLTGAGVEDAYKEKYEALTDELKAFITQSDIEIQKEPRFMEEVLYIKIRSSALNGRLLEAFKHKLDAQFLKR
jgi:hypothetical protein